MLPMLLFNVVSGLVMDKAQNLAKEHVERMIDDVLPDDARDELDKMIADDPTHGFTNIGEAIQAAAEGKLGIPKKDGTLLPVELDLKIIYDPNTKDFDIQRV